MSPESVGAAGATEKCVSLFLRYQNNANSGESTSWSRRDRRSEFRSGATRVVDKVGLTTEVPVSADTLGKLSDRLRDYLIESAVQGDPITYRELAHALALEPPRTIHRVTEALEELMHEDAVAGRPFIASLAISKIRGGLPAPAFFACARRLGRFVGDEGASDARAFYASEFNAAVAFWGGDGWS